jgi:hypothetical protein
VDVVNRKDSLLAFVLERGFFDENIDYYFQLCTWQEMYLANGLLLTWGKIV